MNIKEVQNLLDKAAEAGDETCDYPLVRLKDGKYIPGVTEQYFVLVSLAKAETQVFTGTYRAARTKMKEVNVVRVYGVTFDVAKNTFRFVNSLETVAISSLENAYSTVEGMCNMKHEGYMRQVQKNDLKSRVLGIPMTSDYSERNKAGRVVAKQVLEALGLPEDTRTVVNTDDHYRTNTHAGITITLSFEQLEALLNLKASV